MESALLRGLEIVRNATQFDQMGKLKEATEAYFQSIALFEAAQSSSFFVIDVVFSFA